MLTDTMKDELIRGLLGIFHNDISMIILNIVFREH